jgi:hypothetical protein
MRHWFEGIPEEDKKIYLVIDNLGTDLLITAQGPTLEFRNSEAKFVFQDLASGACRLHFMVRQEIAVIFGPFHQVPFLIIMRDKSNFLIMFHGNPSVVSHKPSLALSALWRKEH